MCSVQPVTLACAIAGVALVGCQGSSLLPEEESPPAQTTQAIVGGNIHSGDPAVIMLQLSGSICTGTLIRPNIVLTAAHCLEDLIAAGQTSVGSVNFGAAIGQFTHRIGISNMAIHRAFGAFRMRDIALVRLREDAPETIAPIPFNMESIGREFVGSEVRTVGFGNSMGDDLGMPGDQSSGSGTKRQAIFVVADVTPEHIQVGNDTINTCQGDSGGPTFATLDGVEKVVAVTSFGPAGCIARSSLARTDVYLNDFLLETIAAWNGPCSQDGMCNTGSECDYIDPDCSHCGFDGVCKEDCENVDLDCPLFTLVGEVCEDKFDCESRLCIEAPEDSRVKFCSNECDPEGNIFDECDTPLTVCRRSSDGVSTCQYANLTPRVQGSECESGDECRSGVCEAEEEICVEPCTTDADCSGEFICNAIAGENFCTLGGGGGCALNRGASGAGLGLFFGFGAIFMLARRQRKIG